ncbi:MAG: hypothetical protein JW719_05205 [Pirellulales bacterium]|nr:hypothetical protein [Pirellulales bacterium]
MSPIDHQGSLNDEAARSKAQLLRRAAGALRSGGNLHAWFVPGRVEVLGKHTDYAGGRSMTFAAEQGIALVARPRDDHRVVVHAVDRAETADFQLAPDLVPRAGHWSNYPMTVARRVARNFGGALRGAEIALAGDLPPAAGMSSSSAVVVGMFLALDAVNRLAERPEYRANLETAIDLAGYLATVENGLTFGSLSGDRGVGTFGGSEDHTAILRGLAGRVSQFAYCPVRFERAVAVPPTHGFVIAVSGVEAEKTGNALARYNAASRSAAVLAELWRRATGRDEPHLAAILATSPDAADRLRQIARRGEQDEFDADSLLARLDHFMAESNEIIPRAGDALASGDLETFGEQVDHSQRNAEQLLGNQVPETAFLAAAARQLGAAAASAFGAGFGGSVWAMVELDRRAAFQSQWQTAHELRFPEAGAAARFFSTAPSPGAIALHPFQGA